MSLITVQADVSQSVFEFLHSELVEYILEKHGSDKSSQPEVIEKLECLGQRVGESLVERASRDTPRFRTELDAVVFICKQFWLLAFNKQVDNLKTNHQDTYVLHDYNFRLLTHISHSEQYKDKAPQYLAFSCGLVNGALTNLGIRCQVSAEATQMPASKGVHDPITVNEPELMIAVKGKARSGANKMFCLSDFEAHARVVLDKNAGEYYSSGADSEQTLRDNQRAFSRYRLRPRVLTDVSQLDTRVKLLGEWVEFPIGVAPTAMQKMAHPDGEIATAKACATFRVCMALSSWSTSSLEDVAKANADGGNSLKWFQLYVYRDRELTRSLIERAERNGYKALVVTVDTPVLGNRIVDNRNRFTLPSHLSLGNFMSFYKPSSVISGDQESGLHRYTKSLIDPTLSWKTIDWLRGITKLPILLKGIVTGEDAKEALNHGVQGIVVSNHGGRQLDGVPATIDALSEVVEAVKGKAEVYLDGGVRCGTDVFKALAMGARAVFIGRPVLWGLAYKGQEGVENVLKLITKEFELAMKLSGCTKVADIRPEMVVHESYFLLPRAKLISPL